MCIRDRYAGGSGSSAGHSGGGKSESALATLAKDPRDAFVLKPPAYRGERLVLNARRLGFDVDVHLAPNVPPKRPWELALDLLRRVFEASPDADASSQAALFDEAAALRQLPLAHLDGCSPHGVLAFFLNLHHALLQHAWLCLLHTSPSPRDQRGSRMPSSA